MDHLDVLRLLAGQRVRGQADGRDVPGGPVYRNG
jgi:hypothetical protein